MCDINVEERKEIERKLTQCIMLNSEYRDAYQKIKNKRVSRLFEFPLIFVLMHCIPGCEGSQRVQFQ